MDLEKLFLTRQSTREFSEREISDCDLKEICYLATLAPSAINGQPYNLYGINGKKAKEFAKYIQVNGANGWADGCKAFIAIEEREAVEICRGERVISNKPFIGNDIGILSAYLALAAENAGIQSCIVGLRDEEGIAKFLGLPEGTRFPLIVALGYKAEGYPLRKKSRRNFDETFKLIK